MNIQRVAVTITLNVDVCNLPEGITWEQVAKMLERDRWDEGRYPFYSEMIHEGLNKTLEGSIGAAVWEQMCQRHGTARVEVENGNQLVAAQEAELAMRGVAAYVNDDIKRAEIKEVQE